MRVHFYVVFDVESIDGLWIFFVSRRALRTKKKYKGELGKLAGESKDTDML